MEQIVFNCEKHHLRTISEKILAYRNTGVESLNQLLESLTLNSDNTRTYNGVVDVYYGPLTADDIQNEVWEYMQKNRIVDLEAYRQYIQSQGQIKRRGHYINHTLSDTSIFTLRLIDDPKSFMHIHPGRYSPNTFRVKANTLKTAIVTAFLALIQKQSPYNLDLVNDARHKLELSPVDEKISSIYDTIEKLYNFLRLLDKIPNFQRPDRPAPSKTWGGWLRRWLPWLKKSQPKNSTTNQESSPQNSPDEEDDNKDE